MRNPNFINPIVPNRKENEHEAKQSSQKQGSEKVRNETTTVVTREEMQAFLDRLNREQQLELLSLLLENDSATGEIYRFVQNAVSELPQMQSDIERHQAEVEEKIKRAGRRTNGFRGFGRRPHTV